MCFKIVLTLLVLSLIPQICFGVATDYYVTTTGAGVKDGLTWAKAFSIAEFEIDIEGNAEAGDRYFIKEGTYTFTTNIDSNAKDATGVAPIEITGVVSATSAEPPTSADWATGTNRPLMAAGAYDWRVGNYYVIRNFRMTTTDAYGFRVDLYGRVENFKSENTDTVGNRRAFYTGAYSQFHNCEGISRNGLGIYLSNYCKIVNSYFHDSRDGIIAGNSFETLHNNIIESCDDGIEFDIVVGGKSSSLTTNNTIYNCNKGFHADLKTASIFLNNIIDSCVVGADWVTEQLSNVFDYNNWKNNGTDVTNVTKGANATAVDPSFTDVTTITGTDGETSGGVLTSTTAKDFSSVVVNQDYCWIKSGTGVTANEFHLITVVDDGADQLTLSPDPGNSGTDDITWSVTTGHDFSIAVGMKAGGFPGTFPGELTTGYLDQGAVQRQEPVAGGGGGRRTGWSIQ